MSYPAHHRVLLYGGTLALHAGNSMAMFYCLYFGKAMQTPDAELILFKNMSFRFVTIWNVVFHIIYSSLSLTCEIYDLLKVERWRQYRQMAENFRNTFFCSLVWPVSLFIFSIFWPIYLYDRDLLFPHYIDKVLSQLSNHAMHTSIFFIVFGEIALNPRKPQNHWLHFKIINGLFFVYLASLFETHYLLGTYPYPLLKMFSRVQFAGFLLFVYIVINISYILQWVFTPILKNYLEERRSKKVL